VRITGETVDREKAKYLLSYFNPSDEESEDEEEEKGETEVKKEGREKGKRKKKKGGEGGEGESGEGESGSDSNEECILRYVDCPVHFIPVLIGTGGYTIEDLQIRTATRILINEYRDEVSYY
jgi:hypothetical protein